MTSWDDALLIFKSWIEKSAHIAYLTVIPVGVDEDGETIDMAQGPTCLIKEVSPYRKTVLCEDASGRSFEADLADATFEYSDTRYSPLLTHIPEMWVCFLEASLPDGTVTVFAELAKCDQ